MYWVQVMEAVPNRDVLSEDGSNEDLTVPLLVIAAVLGSEQESV